MSNCFTSPGGGVTTTQKLMCPDNWKSRGKVPGAPTVPNVELYVVPLWPHPPLGLPQIIRFNTFWISAWKTKAIS